MTRRALALFGLLLMGCPKDKPDGPTPTPSASASTVVPPSSAPPTASASAAAGANSTAATSFAGTYALAPGQMYISDHKDFERVKQAKDDPTQHVGEGTLSLEIGGDGRVSGAIDTGPASPAIIDGTLVDGEIRCTVRRKTIADNGLTGTFTAKSTGEDGRLALAEANAAIVREGKVTLKKK